PSRRHPSHNIVTGRAGEPRHCDTYPGHNRARSEEGKVMRRRSVYWMAAFCMVAAFAASGRRGGAQQPPASDAVTPRAELYPKLEDAFLRWPLPAGAERYGAIDGKRMHKDVVEQAQISRRYRDAGHPKFWGRITGTSSDAESGQWLAAKFKAAG